MKVLLILLMAFFFHRSFHKQNNIELKKYGLRSEDFWQLGLVGEMSRINSYFTFTAPSFNARNDIKLVVSKNVFNLQLKIINLDLEYVCC